MLNRALALLFIFCIITSAIAADHHGTYTLYLVRHAEKQADDGRDPELTVAGRDRAQHLANWLQHKNIEDIWSSDYKRTRDTVRPLVSSTALELKIYDPHQLAALTDKLLRVRHNALIVGHSNSTPELARLICHCQIADMDESEYDRLIVISISGTKTRVETLDQRHLFRLQD